MDDIKPSIVNIEEIKLEKPLEPVTKLVEAVTSAVGAVFEAKRITRRAAAEAKAGIILAEGRAKVAEIEYRAFERIRAKEIRRQRNIESIAGKAKDKLPAAVSSDPVDPDWMQGFFEEGQDISDEEMQTLWSKILASEVTSPGSFSRRTLATLKLMSSSDAELFGRFCSFVWEIDGKVDPIMFDYKSSVFSLNGVNFNSLLHLDSLGLISFNPSATIYLEDEPEFVSYFGQRFRVSSPAALSMVGFFSISLTSVGRELLRIADATPNQEYMALILRNWRSHTRVEFVCDSPQAAESS